MKKILSLISVVAILAACQPQNADTPEAKRAQLQEYKQQLHDLELQIETLENELADNEEVEVVNVKVEQLSIQPFEHFIEVTGKVEAEWDVNVSPESAGVIKEVYVTEGQTVSKGELMAKLNNDILQRSLEEINVQLDLAKTNYERQKNLWDQNIGSEMQYLQTKNAVESLEKRIESVKAQMELAEVRSPIDGIVDEVYQEKGQIGSPQVPFARVLNISRIRVYADVSESYITKFKKGDQVELNFPALGKTVKAPINQIGNSVDPNNRTFRVRINLRNPDKSIKPNLVSIISLRDYVNDSAIVVPSLYIKEDFRERIFQELNTNRI